MRRTPKRTTITALIAGAALLTLSACSESDKAPERLTVFAAASLNEVLTDLAETFEANEGVDVALSFAGSSDLVAQIDAGAPADVLMTADERTMQTAVDAGLIGTKPVLVASNHLVLATPPDNPANITGLDDSLVGTNFVVCAPQVPCGAATERLANLLDVGLTPVSQEQSVTSVLGKVTSGEADAGLVYGSDAAGAGNQVHTIDIPRSDEIVNLYPGALIGGTANADLGQKWLNLVTGPKGQAALAAAGFGTP